MQGDKTEKLFAKLALLLKPPENLTVSQWAGKHRRLSAETSSEQGLWRNSRTPYLVEVMDAFTDPRINHIVLVAASQIGKALAIDTPIATPEGWTTMGELKVGDKVFDEQGNQCKVTFATEIMYGRPCYEIEFSDNSKIVADSEHRWYVESNTALEYPNGKNKKAVFEGVLTTEEIAKSYIQNRYAIPVAKIPAAFIDTGECSGKLRKSETLRRRITAVNPVASVPVKCIQVDSPSHLYLAGESMIPTHNTEAELNMIGYIVDQDPGSILYVHPTTIDAKDFSKLRIAPMIRDCKSLRQKVSDPKSRDSSNTILQKVYPGGILTLCGSTEAHSLASKPIRYVFGDERDRWAISAGTEGDPWELAMARQTTFYNRKAVEVSTPTIKGASQIEAAYMTGTMERWLSLCPHCKQYHEIKWEDIRFDYEESIISGAKTYNVANINYVCPECGCISDEFTMKRQPAHWEAENKTAKGTRSFWLNAFVSQWASWESIIKKFLKARGNSKMMQVVYNTCFGKLWEDKGDIQDENDILARREDYGKREDGSDIELPDGVLVLTCGVDTQDDRLEYEIVGHGHFGETWGIKKGIIIGRPDDEQVWQALDAVTSRVYKFKDHTGLKVSATFVDEGGHFTQNVRSMCKDRIGSKYFCIKGFAGADRPFISPPKKQKIMANGLQLGTCWQYQLGVDSGKQIIMDNLKVKISGAKYCHFPIRADYGETYFNGLLSEHLVYKENSRNKWQWEKIPGHERNEPLDCRNYALAAFKALSVNLDEIEKQLFEVKRLKSMKNETLPKQEAKLPTPAPSEPKPMQRKIQKKKPNGANKFFDSW